MRKLSDEEKAELREQKERMLDQVQTERTLRLITRIRWIFLAVFGIYLLDAAKPSYSIRRSVSLSTSAPHCIHFWLLRASGLPRATGS